MRIVILDGGRNNPGDLDWERFAAHGELEVHAHTPHVQVVERCAGARVVCTNKVVLDADAFAALNEMEAVIVLATGVNVVDLEAARAHGVTVMNVPAYGSASVAQHAVGLMLACCSKVGELDAAVHDGEWVARDEWCFWDDAPIELDGKTLGLIGVGAIGRRVAGIATALGMRVLGYTLSGRPHTGVEMVALPELQARSDVISLHCPLTADNAQLIDRDFLERCREGVVLVNTARGGLLDEAAVAAALESRRLASAGVDVLSSEPPDPANPLLHAPRCVITPHAAWASREARGRLLAIAADNLEAWIAGTPQNVVAAPD